MLTPQPKTPDYDTVPASAHGALMNADGKGYLSDKIHGTPANDDSCHNARMKKAEKGTKKREKKKPTCLRMDNSRPEDASPEICPSALLSNFTLGGMYVRSWISVLPYRLQV
jgi:hypothetical protein